MADVFWHNLSSNETVKALRTNAENGLSEKEVEVRRVEFGKNLLPEEKPLSWVRVFLSQFQSPLIYILVIAGFTTLFLREFTDSIVIFGAVFLNAIVGFFQENKASKALRELKRIVKYETKAVREGGIKVIDSSELVPGDLIVLSPGDKIPADGRVVESHGLKVNQMVLTGEWLAAEKKIESLDKETQLADRSNMVYTGGVIEDGKGKVVVVETGRNTEIGKVAEMVKETKEEKTPLQNRISGFSRVVGLAIAAIAAFIFVEGIATGNTFLEMFTTSIAVAVAAIPEGLPVATTIILALGMQRILKRKGLVRKLLAAETLGSTSIIATDKTCTLTEGRMKVDEIFGDRLLSLKTAVLTSEAFIENPKAEKEEWIVRGRPTEKALLEAGVEEGINGKTEFEKRKIAELPFNPVNKFAAAVYQEDNGNVLYVCGAPEKILESSILPEKEKMGLDGKLEQLAQKGLRVVATASRRLIKKDEDDFPHIEKLCRDLKFTGFITMKDPVRREAAEAMRVCRQAGMKPIIVTGDHRLTAKAVAYELGFKFKDENILEGKDLDLLSDEEFGRKLEKIQLYSRVEPKHKLRIIGAWQQKGEVVAMTGDGVNDAPALKKADIGVALGSGTEVAKETSDLILLNDSFSIIVAAVEEGRAIMDNIRKVITFLLCDAFTEVILIGASIIARVPLPITAVQILWVNLIEDGLPNIALAFEPKEKDLMKKKPEAKKNPLLTREMKAIIFIVGIFTDIILLGLFFWLWKNNHDIGYVRTMVFSCLGVNSLFYVFSCKSLRYNLWEINIFSNRFLVFSVFVGFFLLLISVYLPVSQALLKTVPLGFVDWLIVFALGFINMFFIEIAKRYFIIKERAKARIL